MQRSPHAAQLIARAVHAYLRNPIPVSDAPSIALCDVMQDAGKTYVVLQSTDRLLACYRVRRDGRLMRLDPVPSVVASKSA